MLRRLATVGRALHPVTRPRPSRPPPCPPAQVLARPLHNSFVRYFGIGRTVMCLHQDGIQPSAILMPPPRMAYSLNAQLMWLKQEAAELCQV